MTYPTIIIPQSLLYNQNIHKQLFARYHELQTIRDELRKAAGLDRTPPNKPIIATGHQPAFYYPGLLFKNYFVSQIARESQGEAINFVVDTDIANYQAPVPSRANDEFFKTLVLLKNTRQKTYADFNPSKEEIQEFFGEIAGSLNSLNKSSIRYSFDHYRKIFWQAFKKTNDFPETVRLLRNQFDSSADQSVRDIKISYLTKSKGFMEYVWYLVRHIHFFTTAFNKAVQESKTGDYQPVKFLYQDTNQYELPFWLVREGTRQAIFIEKDENKLVFYDQDGKTVCNLTTKGKSHERLIHEMQENLRLYPKATSLTLMIRLFISDIFVHGTGGPEYEKINNRLIKELFSLPSSPVFYTATGDIRLPLMNIQENYHQLKTNYEKNCKWLKDVERDPEDHLPEELAKQYKKEKIQLANQLRNQPGPAKRKELHEQLLQRNERMKKHLKDEINRVKEELSSQEGLLNKQEVFFERKYPWFIYPEGFLTKEKIQENLAHSEN